MLHILLLILKILGIILAVILGILLLLVCIILFVPIRYEISAKCDGTLESLRAKVKATWLLYLVRVDVFLKGKRLKWKVRLAWLKKTNVPGEVRRKEEKIDESEETEPQKVEKADIKEEDIQDKDIEKCEDFSEEIKEHRLDGSLQGSTDNCEADSDTIRKNSEGSKIKNLVEKIIKSIQNICDKIKDLLEKKEKITEFLTEKSHINAFKKVKKGLTVLLRRLKPKKIRVKLKFGFEDPCTTGQVLGGLSMLYPFLGDAAEIIPDFENKILEGNVYLKGRIRLCHIVALALKLLICKDVRTSYKDIRNFKL